MKIMLSRILIVFMLINLLGTNLVFAEVSNLETIALSNAFSSQTSISGTLLESISKSASQDIISPISYSQNKNPILIAAVCASISALAASLFCTLALRTAAIDAIRRNQITFDSRV